MATPTGPIDRVGRLAASWLRRTLPADVADDVVGDLLEHAARRRRGRRRWLIVEAVRLAWGFQRRPGRGPRRSLTHALDTGLQDLRYAARALVRAPGFAVLAVTSLTLGIGLATAVFSVVDGLLLRPLPYDAADAIVRIQRAAARNGPQVDAIDRGLLRRWQSSARVIEAFGPYAFRDATIRVGDQSYAGVQVDVGGRFFDVMRTRPAYGRLLTREDADKAAPMVALVSNAFWRSAFHGRVEAVGQSISIDDRAVTVVGILPDDFGFPSTEVAIFVPGRSLIPEIDPGTAMAFLAPPLELVARLRDGASTADVERELDVVAGRKGDDVSARFTVVRLRDDLVRSVRPALLMLTAAVACVLAIVCVNLTNLLLARGTARQREIGVRAALGASRWGMVRPLLLEGLIVTGTGAVAGLVLAFVLVGVTPLSASIDPMLATQVRVDARVVMFTIGVAVLIGAGISSLPAWQARTGDIRNAVAGGAVTVMPGAALRAGRLRAVLVVAQVALAIVLAVGALLLSRSLVKLVSVDLGFQPERALSAQLRLGPSTGDWGWAARFYQDFIRQLERQPVVEAAGFTTSLPMQQTFSQAAIRIDGAVATGALARVHREAVTPGYFAAIGLPVTSGRGFTEADRDGSEPVAIVNEAFVRALLADRVALGQRLMVFGRWARLIGVVRSKRHMGLRADVRPELYIPLAQSPPDVVTQSTAGVVIRTSSEPNVALPMVRSTLRGMRATAAIEHEGELAGLVWASTATPRFYAAVMAAFAILAVVTALVGLFGILSFIVEQRRAEIGLRRALGASARDISNLVIGRGLALVALAVPIGLAGAIAGVDLLRTMLFGIEPLDITTFAVVLVSVPAVSLAACAWPARRALAIEPLEALREE